MRASYLSISVDGPRIKRGKQAAEYICQSLKGLPAASFIAFVYVGCLCLCFESFEVEISLFLSLG